MPDNVGSNLPPADRPPPRSYSLHLEGDLSGQVAMGEHITH